MNGNAATNPTPDAFGTVGGLVFPTTGSKYAYFQWEVPLDWTGGNMTVEIDWVPFSGAMSGTDTVKWDIDYVSKAEGEDLNGTATAVPVTIDADIAQYISTHTPFTLAYNDANNPLVHEDHIYFRISRDTGVANDFAGSVMITAFELLYTSNGIPEV
jgi:hypothetical protein